LRFVVKYCDLCETDYVECPRCKNNCCSGGYGVVDDEECDVCPLAYQFQDLYWSVRYPELEVELD